MTFIRVRCFPKHQRRSVRRLDSGTGTGRCLHGRDIDGWRHRALHVDGLNEWEYDALMGRIRAPASRPLAYAVSRGIAFCHLVGWSIRTTAGTETRRKRDRFSRLQAGGNRSGMETRSFQTLSEYPAVEGRTVSGMAKRNATPSSPGKCRGADQPHSAMDGFGPVLVVADVAHRTIITIALHGVLFPVWGWSWDCGGPQSTGSPAGGGTACRSADQGDIATSIRFVSVWIAIDCARGDRDPAAFRGTHPTGGLRKIPARNGA